MASFGYVWFENRINSGLIDWSETFTMYLLSSVPSDPTESSLAAVRLGRELQNVTNYNPVNFTFTFAVNGSQAQRRITNPSWPQLGTSSDFVAALLVGHEPSDTPVVVFEEVTGKTLTGGDAEAIIQNADYLANVQ